MSRAACAKEILNSGLVGKIDEWKAVELGLMRVVRSKDFAALSDEKQKELLDPVMGADHLLLNSLAGALDSYQKAGAAILESL